MIEATFKDLIEREFIPIRFGSINGLPEYMGRENRNSCVIMKHLIDDKYAIHVARDLYGEGYDEAEINGTDRFDSIKTLDLFIKFLEKPDFLKKDNKVA